MTPDEIIKALREWRKQGYRERSEAFSLVKHAADLIESLQSQLAASQHRERAAVKQIEQKMIFDAGMGREPCEICANAEKTPCIHCEPKWRGPQEAWKGNSND